VIFALQREDPGEGKAEANIGKGHKSKCWMADVKNPRRDGTSRKSHHRNNSKE
jgi:hypothetical protein